MSDFTTIYEKYYKMLHHILAKYRIRYNYDEYFQLLLIRLWELTNADVSTTHPYFSNYLYQRLSFYLIDIFRSQSKYFDYAPIQDATHMIASDMTLESQTLLIALFQCLSPSESLWLSYYLQGYKQYEICQYMKRSDSTIRRCKQHVREKLAHFMQDGGI